ncbi:MAG TPA: hypothetical protein VFX78_04620 [Candidatus Eisenbacteria bacterium]|nr:hypothetical protein [Candidatus Eisenbacteria bacterium]
MTTPNTPYPQPGSYPAVPPPEKQQVFDIRDILWRVTRYRWLLVVPIVISMSGAAIYYTLAPAIFESHVLVAIDDQAQVSGALQGLVQPDRDRDTPRERVTLVDSKVRSRRFLQELSLRSGFNRDPQVVKDAERASRRWRGVPRDEFAIRFASARLSKRIRVTPVEGTYVRISAMGPAPEEARRIASLIADILIEESKRTNLERVQARGEFSADQITVYEERLRKSEDAYQRYQESLIRNVLSSNPVNDRNIEDARGLINMAESEMAQVKQRLESEQRDFAGAANGASVPDLQGGKAIELSNRLVELESSASAAALSDKEKSDRNIAGIQASIASTRQMLLAELELEASQLKGNLSDEAQSAATGIALDRAIIRSLTLKRDRLRGLISEYARTVQSTPREDMELARLKGEVDTNRDLLNALRREQTSSRISEALETSGLGFRLSVLEPPQLPYRASEPDPFKIFAAAALLGPLGAAGIVLLGEKVRLVVRSVEQAEEELGARVIATFPRIEGWSRPGTYFQNNWPVMVIIAVVFLTGSFFALNATVFAPHPIVKVKAETKK